ADKDALPAVPLEKPDAARQHLGVAGEWPHAPERTAIAPPDPVRHRIAEYGAGDRTDNDRPKGQHPVRHQRAGGDEERRAGEQEAQKREAFTERGDEHDDDRPARMRGDKGEHRLNQIVHRPVQGWKQAAGLESVYDLPQSTRRMRGGRGRSEALAASAYPPRRPR